MISKILIFVLVGVIAQAHSACVNCGLGHGKDVCTHHCSTMVVRPAKLPKIDISELYKPRVVCKQVGGITPFKPIGDLCCCNRAIVTPAKVPKPACALCKSECAPCSSVSSVSIDSSSSESASTSHSHSHSHTSTYSSNAGSSCSDIDVDAYGIPAAPETPGYAPADPVSLALAYKLQNNANRVSEDKLSFGFRTMPKEITICKEVKHVYPEENLYGLNGQVVELKPVVVHQKENVDEEAAETLLHTEEEQEGIAAVKKITYGEIGFGPEQVKEVPYIKVEGHVDTGSVGSQTHCAKQCLDGYVSGKVIVEPLKKHEICIETTSGAEGDDNDNDSSSEEEYVSYSKGVPVSYPAYRGSYSARASSSSSSCSARRHNVIIEKLRCS